MITNANKIKIRCSSLGYLMTEPREIAKQKAGELSETAKTHLVDIFVSQVWGRREELNNKFLEKGNVREEDNITLQSILKKEMYRKNEERIENDFISGTPDFIIEDPKTKVKKIYDTKTSFSAHTFFRSKYNPLPDKYKWQVTGYMALTGANSAHVAFGLVNGTAKQILKEKYNLGFLYNEIDINLNPDYVNKCIQIEKNHIFDMKAFVKENPGFDFHCDPYKWEWDIPIEQRSHIFDVPRVQADIDKIQWKVLVAREWMNKNLFKI